MPNIPGKRQRPQISAIIKGTMVSVLGAVVACAAAAYLISKGHISEKLLPYIAISILLLASFLGTKYSNIASQENRSVIAMITGAAFVLILTIANAIILSGDHSGILPKVGAVIAGTALGAADIHGKRQGRGLIKHRYNR